MKMYKSVYIQREEEKMRSGWGEDENKNEEGSRVEKKREREEETWLLYGL